jgi:hypothetical protein
MAIQYPRIGVTRFLSLPQISNLVKNGYKVALYSIQIKCVQHPKRLSLSFALSFAFMQLFNTKLVLHKRPDHAPENKTMSYFFPS